MRREWMVVAIVAAFAACGRSPLWVDVDPDAGLAAGMVAGAAGASGVAVDAGGIAGHGGGAGVGNARKGLGEACAKWSECASSQCTAGICCDSACTGDCSSCALPGSVGRCSPVPAATACGTPPTCSADGVSVMGNGICDGKGSCRAGPKIVCVPFACDPATGGCRSSCASNADCAPGLSCLNGSCASRHNPGIACKQDKECATGYCRNGVCCSTACDGDCVSCAMPGTVGTCWPAAPGTKCGAPGKCSGDILLVDSVCDGQGGCFRAADVICTPFNCDAATTQCRTKCASNADCSVGVPCVNGVCGFRPPSGSCISNSDCASGFCADGVCCDRPCDGKCQTCAMPGRVGVCSPAEPGAFDPHGVCPDQGAASCGFNGRCDGTGGCQSYAPGTMCSAPQCSGATLTLAGTCNAQHACLAPIESCAPAMCRADGTGCQATATCSDASCPAGFYCTAPGTCAIKKPGGTPCGSDHECTSNACLGGNCQTLI